MRRLGFGISCALACGVFFGDVAPGKYDPAPSNLKSEVAVIPKTPIGTWTTTGNITAVNIEAVEPDDLSADVPSNDPNDLKRPTSFERAKAALAQSGATALSHQELCATLLEVARSNDLPLGFLTNLIWRESRFDHDAISPVGAMGIAQFMPNVAEKLSLDAFDSRSALPASGRLLRTLRARFGNLGLAAAAYNAGPKRVSDWLDGRSPLPKETDDYVYLITGRPAAHWQNVKPQAVVFHIPRYVPCHRSPTFALAEQAERIQQARMVAEEARRAEQRTREAARRQKEVSQKRKVVARLARLKIASRVQATKSPMLQHSSVMRLAQFKR